MSGPESTDERPTYVSRGGLKLHHALREFDLDPAGFWCADLGCSTGGFTHCLLEHGAARVFAVDTGYGVLDYRLRTDERVSVYERSNALHLDVPDEVAARGGINLVTIDMSWTVQEKCLPAAGRWLGPGGRIISLVKPHYEATGGPFREELGSLVVDGVLDEADGRVVLDRTLADLSRLGFQTLGWTPSPILGGQRKPKRRKKASPRPGTGNLEYLVLIEPLAPDQTHAD